METIVNYANLVASAKPRKVVESIEKDTINETAENIRISEHALT